MWTIIPQLLAAIIQAGINYKTNSALMDKSEAYNTKTLDKQLEYASQSHQIEEMKKAGINPSSLAMGSGSYMQSSPSPALPLSLFPTDFSSISQSINQLSNSRLTNAQAKTEDLLRAERYDQMKVQTQKYVAEIEKLGVDTRGQQIANFYASALNEVSLMKSKSELGINFRQMAIMNKELQIMTKQLNEVIPQEIAESKSREKLNVLNQEEVVAQIARIKQETQNLEKEGDLLEAKLDTEGLIQNELGAEIKESASRTTQLDQQIQLYLDTYDDLLTEVAAKAKISKKQAQWYIVQQIFSIGINSAIMVGSTAYGAKAIKGLKGTPKVGF